MISTRVCAILGIGALSTLLVTTGCTQGPRTACDFKVPRIYLHLHRDPQEVQVSAETEGLVVLSRSPQDYVIVIDGTGLLRLDSDLIMVGSDRIEVKGVVVASRPDGYRNVTITRGGKVEPDRFIPFEPWWGYHPRLFP